MLLSTEVALSQSALLVIDAQDSFKRIRLEGVAAECGFADARQLRRLWTRHFGAPPSAFRDLDAQAGCHRRTILRAGGRFRGRLDRQAVSPRNCE